MSTTNHHFKKGDEIEVHKNPSSGDTPAWFPAKIINTPSPSRTELHVKYTTLSVEKKDGKRKRKKLKEYVDVSEMRPAPAPETQRRFVGGETVEVYYDKGWRKGKVVDVLGDVSDDEDDGGFMYKVLVDGLEVMVKDFQVRVFKDWKLDFCHQKQEESPRLVLQSRNGTKLRIICTSRTPKTTPFEKGTHVEIRSHEEGYHGCWYTAIVVSPGDEKDKLWVQYDTLNAEDDQTKPLVEMACVSNIRPLPPIYTRLDRFKPLEEVDAWYNDGWWSGLISKVLTGKKYIVYFWTTNEELEFEHSTIRPHQEWMDGKWVASFLRPKVDLKGRPEKVKLQMGERTLMVGLKRGVKVEIAHGEKGSLTTWYPAVIVGSVRNGNYMVEYRTLTTKNGSESVKEEVDALSIRPCPPIIQRPEQFQVNDKVDAWDFKGWQIGQISRTLKDSKYEVSFRVTNTVSEFRHADLRPRQTYINGEWILDPKGVLTL